MTSSTATPPLFAFNYMPLVGTPFPLHIGRRVRKVACGEFHTMLISEEGHIFSFGSCENGRLGLGPAVNVN